MSAWRFDDTRAEPDFTGAEEVTATPCKRSFWDRADRFAYRTTWRDPLVELARCRAINHRSHSYASARRIAMRPVDLPLDDAHLLVSPETAAYFNALTRAA